MCLKPSCGSKTIGKLWLLACVLLLLCPLVLYSQESSTILETSTAPASPNSENTGSSPESLLEDSLQLINQLAQNLNSREDLLKMLSGLSAEQLAALKSVLPILTNLGPFLTKTGLYLNDSARILPKLSDLLEKDWEALDSKSKQVDSLKSKNTTLKFIASVGLAGVGIGLGYSVSGWQGAAVGAAISSGGIAILVIVF